MNCLQRFRTVRNTLQHHMQGKDMEHAIEKFYDEKERKSFVRILVNELVEVHGNYPSEKAKIALAKAIVIEFVCFKSIFSLKRCVNFKN